MQIKVYMSRSSMCMADDVNAPNPGTFILPNTLEGFVSIVDLILPFYDWDCYLGKYIKTDSPDSGLEDGILVWKIKSGESAPIVTRYYDENGKVIIKHDDNWHEEIVNYPYLYFYKKD